ncbi:uncharacterized protein HD556DRAFT_1449998 [Suillus plorans]|uniref:Uncharacterized protein n=1 Tax=Suillus plorans TaxID=116603 RepID=A0A9P7ABU5_9AGAM|nr:uncharacterized protein HD556DRAFT_1449998 [Suillus plorans]KAG1786141.1 hypothetical protein HD556DRAFT_1449998 [Suillus plorans]
MPASDSMFLLCRRYQRSSTELVIYSRDVKQCVEIAYPVSRTTRTRVMPAGIAQFLRRRCTSWECFCGAVEERATPVCFVSTMNGFTKAVCYFRNNKCGFSINLNETCHTAHHISTYEDWPVFQAAANTAALVTRFELRQLNSPLHHSEIAPYFVDYLGAHRSIHPSQTWTRTVSAIPARTNNNRRRHSAVFPTARDQLLGHAHRPVQHPMQHVEPDALVVPPEDVPDLPMVQEGPILSPNKQDHLFKLAAGGGIHEFDANCLLEKCDGCRRVFIPTALRLHIIEGCGER